MAEPVYRCAVALRNSAFDRKLRRTVTAPCHVVSVGNLTTGGTGKTPLVHWLVRYLVDQGHTVGVVSRGYRSLAGGANDEALEFALAFPNVAYRQNPKRWLAVRDLVSQNGVTAIVLDDGFQHRQLARDVDVVTIDALEPWGYGHLLPRGLLREPLSALGRADCAVITRANLCPPSRVDSIASAISRYVDRTRIAVATVEPSVWMLPDGTQVPLPELAGRNIVAFCGLGRPEAFYQTLVSLKMSLRAWRPFPDHHHYTTIDVEALQRQLEVCKADYLVCTVKDLVKLKFLACNDLPIAALQIGHRFIDTPVGLLDRLSRLLTKQADCP